MPILRLDSFLDYVVAGGGVLLLVGVALVLYGWRRSARADIRFPEWPEDLDWSDPAAVEASLARVHRFARAYSGASRDWYRERRKTKRQVGFGLRLGAMFATAAAGIYPIAGPLATSGPVEVGWSAVLAGLAALFLAIDKFGGYTSGWVRYMLAEQEVERLERSFLLEWERVRLQGAVPSSDRASKLLRLVRLNVLRVFDVVSRETRAWAAEFRAALREIEATAVEAAAPEAGEPDPGPPPAGNGEPARDLEAPGT